MADSNAMYSSALLYQAMLMLLMCIVFILVWSRGCRHNILEELRAPLLPEETPEHRIDAATRAAEDGFARCGGCTFENFKRFSHCAICGDALAVTTSSTEPDQEPVMAAASTTKTVSARQLRARKRKEWTRRLNGDGSFSWERSPVEDASGGVWSAPPGFIVQFKTEKPDHDDENRVATAETTLAEELVAPRLLLVDALDADAASFPTGQSVDSDNDRRAELARMTTLDFPSKYAHFVVSTASLVVPAEVEFLKLSVHRDFLLEESIDHMCCIQEKNMKSVMRINFLDERAVDAGGVQREWMLLLTELLVYSELQLFVCRNQSDQSFYLNPVSLQDVGDEHLKYYFAVGRLIGRVLLEGSVWGFHFSVPLLKMILGQPVSFDDLQSCDPDLHRNLRWLLENDGAESLGLDFSVNEKTRSGETVVVDLIAGGRDIPVTDENKLLYVERLFKYVLFDSVGLQLHALLKGVYEVIPHDLLMLYDVEEFDYLLCGTDEIDVEDWRAHSKQSLNLNGTRVVDWFWEEVAAMSPEYRRRLLVFATGSSRVPLAGFRGLTSYDGRLCPFTLKGVSTTSDKYIVSHACFNRLDLPLYKTKAELHTVLYAILDGDVYGFTSA